MVSITRNLITRALAYKILVKRMKKRKYWVHPVNLRRSSDGEHLKIDDMYHNYPQKFFEYTRMTPAIFDDLLSRATPHLQHASTNFRESISPRIRLYVILRYLATGDHIRTIATNFSMGRTTIWKILNQGLPVIWNILRKEFVKAPEQSDWISISRDFLEDWNYPHCLGAIDGKHVILECPSKSGSLYLNYKGTFSIVLLATCDAKYKFTTVDVGAFGKQSDGGVFQNSALGKRLKAGTLPNPKAENISNTVSIPFHFVGDEAFPLSLYMMRPYPSSSLDDNKRIFNYRLSRARRCIENAFGIMAARFRVFRKPIAANPNKAEKIVLAAVALHNFIKTKEAALPPSARVYCSRTFEDSGDESNGAWRNEPAPGGLESIKNLSVAAHERMCKRMRDELKDYFTGPGAVLWQNKHIGI